ncbi:uncharacterized protein DUF3152 [Stackebrandtia albiflava]|uniref:Uncharacterized protein DUF3152 n=2 Tax=Stackebrandtia albiflava TaxID=406432 RepID=A0A562V4S2_9ACTN|nr:uncharacterized protein DUF3152 [Stackebrandtia albiflava]
MLRRRRRTVLGAVLLLVSVLLTTWALRDPAGDHVDAAMAESTSPDADQSADADGRADAAAPEPEGTPSPTPTVTERGDGDFEFADVPSDAEVVGDGGELMTYRVAVENGIGEEPDEFAAFVARVLADERGWTAGGDWRFTHSDEDWVGFTIYLVSPATRAELCGSPDTFTSCRNGDAVVINLERWLLAVEHWDAPLESYREYVVNHEIGHRLGEGHVVCPEAGAPSPVMAQQTLELRGCRANAWPYVDGEYLTGPLGEYE